MHNKVPDGRRFTGDLMHCGANNLQELDLLTRQNYTTTLDHIYEHLQYQQNTSDYMRVLTEFNKIPSIYCIARFFCKRYPIRMNIPIPQSTVYFLEDNKSHYAKNQSHLPVSYIQVSSETINNNQANKESNDNTLVPFQYVIEIEDNYATRNNDMNKNDMMNGNDAIKPINSNTENNNTEHIPQNISNVNNLDPPLKEDSLSDGNHAKLSPVSMTTNLAVTNDTTEVTAKEKPK
jgi:hypothetical protein